MTQFTNIETERLLIRPLKKSDWEMISFLRSDKTVNQFIKRPNANSKGKALEFILKINSSITNGQLFYWAITEKSHKKMIGTICLWNFSESKQTAEIGFDLAPEYQGKGFMTEAVIRVLQFGFTTLKLKAIEAYTHKDNLASIKLLENNHFNLVSKNTNKYDSDTVIFNLDAENYK